MSDQLKASIIRIQDSGGKIVGSGFLVADRLALTCAHVVASALGLRTIPLDTPADTITLDFPLAAPGESLTARVVAWQSGTDVAVLKVEGEMPPGIQPAKLVQAGDLWGHEFRAFGFPSGYDDGVWADGRILGPQAAGWLQIQDVEQTGYFVQPGFSGGLVWDVQLGGVVGITVAADTRQAVRAAFILPVAAIVNAWPALETHVLEANPEPPYKGMTFFTASDTHLFFGRGSLTAALVARLHTSRFLAVIGASGSGKSSVVRAGVLPALAGETQLQDGTSPPAGSTTWETHVIKPTESPLEALATSLTRDTDSRKPTLALLDDMQADARSLHLFIKKHLAKTGSTRLLLLVDQFEELFTLCKDPVERQVFIDNLLHAALEAPTGVLVLILTLRADFYHHCAEYANLRQALETHQAYIGAMTKDEMRQAIEAPAAQNGLTIEAGLVERMLNDVGNEPGALPLLSQALLKTWENRQGDTLTHTGYQKAGEVKGAIAKTAEEVYASLSPEGKEIARRIFLRLTELGEGREDTRRRASLQELLAGDRTHVEAEAILTRLANERLITTEKNVAEVAHEALIREWGQLRGWLDEDREALRTHRHLTQTAKSWDKRSRDPSELYRGTRLAQAQAWAEDHAGEMSDLEREFLEASEESLASEKRADSIRQFALFGTIALALILGTLAVTGQLNQFIYRPLDMEDYWITIPEGEFLMGTEGCGGGDECGANGMPVHVYLDTYQIGRFEITNRQWDQCERAGKCATKVASADSDQHPVVSVTWYDAVAFCEYAGGRLPTEAEWEKAARGGLEGMDYPWGNDPPGCVSGAKNGAQFFECDGSSTVRVGSFAPNGYGLYDMAGNVWEWVADWYDSSYYGTLEDGVDNPTGPASGELRVLRGGSWDNDGNFVRAANRVRLDPSYTAFNVGFRCARSP